MKHLFAPILLILIFTSARLPAQNHVCFLGITGDGAPGSRQSFEQQLRNVMDTMDGVHLVDFVSSMRYREITELDRYSRSSRNLLGNLVYHIPDTVLVIWGTIESVDFQPVRKHVLGAAVNGSLIAGLSAFSLKQKKFAFNGTVTSSVTVKEQPVYLSPVEKVTHLSASKRSVLTDSLIHLAVVNCHDVLRSILKESGKLSADLAGEDQSQQKAPSISDVFTVPSLEARQIERGSSEKAKNGATTETENSPELK